MHQYEVVPLETCYKEMDKILREEHWPELGHYKDIPIDMDWARYFDIEKHGKLRCFTVRAPINEEFKETELIGYGVYIVTEHLHYKQTLVASQDTLYIRKPYRGFGRDFIKWIDGKLKAEGVVTVIHHVKPYFDWSKILKEQGYEPAELIFSKRL